MRPLVASGILVAAFFVLIMTSPACVAEEKLPAPPTMASGSISPNDFKGSDSERINQAIEVAAAEGKRVIIPKLNRADGAPRDIWLLDSAILVRTGTTLELDNCHIKLSDRCRDNFIRSANCGVGITDIAPMSDIHIVGVGSVLLEGADHPRATGDAAKTLGERTYGTDAGVPGESQTGDWRNIGILLGVCGTVQHREPAHQGLPLLGNLAGTVRVRAGARYRLRFERQQDD